MKFKVHSSEFETQRRKSKTRLGLSSFSLQLLPGLCLLLLVSPLFAQTYYNQPFASGHGWTYTQASCSGTCTSGDATADGNPLPSVFASVTGRNKTLTGYFSKSFTWEQLGVAAGDTVTSADGAWDDKAIATAVACNGATAGMQIFDAANAAEVTASAVEPALNVAGDTASWITHNPTGPVAVNAGAQASATTVTLRFNLNPSSGNNGSAACELRGDNFGLTLTSTAPSGRSRVVIVAFTRKAKAEDRNWNRENGKLKLDHGAVSWLDYFPFSSFGFLSTLSKSRPNQQ
jgi:hypothetical protein